MNLHFNCCRNKGQLDAAAPLPLLLFPKPTVTTGCCHVSLSPDTYCHRLFWRRLSKLGWQRTSPTRPSISQTAHPCLGILPRHLTDKFITSYTWQKLPYFYGLFLYSDSIIPRLLVLIYISVFTVSTGIWNSTPVLMSTHYRGDNSERTISCPV